MDEQLSTVLGAVVPDRDVAEVEATGPSWNDRNWTVRLSFENGDTAYLNFVTDGRTRIAREQAVIPYVPANTGIPVPRVVASDPRLPRSLSRYRSGVGR